MEAVRTGRESALEEPTIRPTWSHSFSHSAEGDMQTIGSVVRRSLLPGLLGLALGGCAAYDEGPRQNILDPHYIAFLQVPTIRVAVLDPHFGLSSCWLRLSCRQAAPRPTTVLALAEPG
jgi:hypothetical protein